MSAPATKTAVAPRDFSEVGYDEPAAGRLRSR